MTFADLWESCWLSVSSFFPFPSLLFVFPFLVTTGASWISDGSNSFLLLRISSANYCIWNTIGGKFQASSCNVYLNIHLSPAAFWRCRSSTVFRGFCISPLHSLIKYAGRNWVVGQILRMLTVPYHYSASTMRIPSVSPILEALFEKQKLRMLNIWSSVEEHRHYVLQTHHSFSAFLWPPEEMDQIEDLWPFHLGDETKRRGFRLDSETVPEEMEPLFGLCSETKQTLSRVNHGGPWPLHRNLKHKVQMTGERHGQSKNSVYHLKTTPERVAAAVVFLSPISKEYLYGITGCAPVETSSHFVWSVFHSSCRPRLAEWNRLWALDKGTAPHKFSSWNMLVVGVIVMFVPHRCFMI